MFAIVPVCIAEEDIANLSEVIREALLVALASGGNWKLVFNANAGREIEPVLELHGRKIKLQSTKLAG